MLAEELLNKQQPPLKVVVRCPWEWEDKCLKLDVHHHNNQDLNKAEPAHYPPEVRACHKDAEPPLKAVCLKEEERQWVLDAEPPPKVECQWVLEEEHPDLKELDAEHPDPKEPEEEHQLRAVLCLSLHSRDQRAQHCTITMLPQRTS